MTSELSDILGFESVIGQPQATRLLQRAMETGRIAPAYLLVGPSGIGKGLTASCFLRCLLSPTLSREALERVQERIEHRNHPDLLWVEPTYQHQGKLLSAREAQEKGVQRKAPPRIRIEQVREIARFLGRPALESDRSLVVIDGAESMAESAANALLKTLEEPGQATIIAIATSEAALLPTIVSRCTRIPFYRLSPDAMARVLGDRGYGHILQDATIMGLAQGSPGAAIAAIEQLQACSPELLAALHQLPQNPCELLELGKTISGDLDSPAQLWLIEYLQHYFWKNMRSSHILHHLEKARRALLSYVQPRLVWEVTLLAIGLPE